MNQKNDNFIDKTFTVLADIILKVLPATKDEKQAFSYYRYGMAAQSSGDYAEALENYYEALKLEEDPFDRSYILYNIGLKKVWATMLPPIKTMPCAYVQMKAKQEAQPEIFK